MFQNIWQLRERIAEALLRNGFVYKYDVSLPHDKFYEIIPVLKEKLKGSDAEIVSGYGHLGKPMQNYFSSSYRKNYLLFL